MQDAASSPDGPGRHRRGVRVHGRRAAAALRRPPRPGRARSPPATRMAGTRAADLYPSLAAAYPDLAFSAYDPADGGRPRPGVPRAAPRGEPGASCPSCSGTVGHLVDLAADFRLQDPTPLPAVVRRGAHRARAAARRSPTACPSCSATRSRRAAHVATPGLLPDGGLPGAGPAGAGRAWWTTSGIIVDAASGVSGAGRPPKPTTTFCTVDEDFTAYGLLDHRHTPEMEQVLGASVLFTPHLAPMNRGILATCYARPTGATHHRGAARPPAGGLRRRALRRGARGLAVDQGHPGLERRPRHGSLRRAHGHRAGHRRHRQPHQGCVGRARSSAPTCSSASPRPPASPSPGSTREALVASGVAARRPAPAGNARTGRGPSPMSVTAAAGFSANGVACGIKPSGDLDLSLVATTDGRAGGGGRRLHPEQDDRGTRRHDERPPHPHRRAGGRGRPQQRLRQRRHRAAGLWPTPRRCAPGSPSTSAAPPTRCSSAPPV